MIERLVAHVRSLWSGWGVLSPLPLMAWPLYCFSRGEFRWELVALFFVVPLLAFGNAASKKLYLGLYPLGLVGIAYDSMRFFKNLGITAARVHDCDLRNLELKFFSVNVDGVPGTYHDWFQRHSVRFLDFYGAIPYGTFLYIAIAFAIFLYRKDFLALRRYAWTFFVLNIAGFITYHLYPAAPPWYFHAHGCVVNLASKASEGPNLARVDAALGIRYFAGFYGRSNDVFGAMPSLHVAYPTLILLEGWRLFRTPWRIAAIVFALSMYFSAVYLDHHWVLDVLAGIVYCLAAHGGMRLVFAKRVREEREQARSAAAIAER